MHDGPTLGPLVLKAPHLSCLYITAAPRPSLCDCVVCLLGTRGSARARPHPQTRSSGSLHTDMCGLGALLAVPDLSRTSRGWDTLKGRYVNCCV